MTITSWTNRWLNRLYKAFAVLLVLFAVLLSSFRLVLPYVENFRQSFEDYVNSQFQGEIRVGELSADWQKNGPVLVARNVTMFSSEALKVDMKELDLQVDFWGTLKEQKLKTTHLTLVGLQVEIDNNLLGSDHKVQQGSPVLDGIADLFLDQVERFTVVDSKVFIKDFHGVERTFNVSRLAWLNSGDRHQAIGDFEVEGITTNTAKFIFDVTGRHRDEINGQFYTLGQNINITPWLGKFIDIDTKTAQTNINIESWVTFTNGVVKSWQFAFGDNSLTWQAQDGEHELAINGGQLLWQKAEGENNGGFLSGDAYGQVVTQGLSLTLDNQLLNPLEFNLKKDRSGLFGYVSELDLNMIAALYPLVESDVNNQDALVEASPSGKVTDIQFNYINQDSFAIVAQLNDIATQGFDAVPGFEQFDAEFIASESKVTLAVSSEDKKHPLALDFHQHFLRPIPYQALSAQIEINFSDEGWQLAVPEVSLVSEELQLTGEFLLEQLAEQESYLAISANIVNVDAKNAKYYYPLELMDEDLVDYLNAAIVEGTLTDTKVLFNGIANSFPFNDGRGIFVVDANLNQGNFIFDPEWPAITEMNAGLNFTNDSMTITLNHGQLLNLNAQGTVAHITSFSGETVLDVTANIASEASNVSEMIAHSPLSTSVGEALKEVEIQGDISGDFQLLLPFDDLDKTVARGNVNFQDNQVHLNSLDMDFSQVKGTLYYNNDDIDYDNINLMWRDMPLTIRGKALEQEKYYQAQLLIDAQWEKEAWQNQVPKSLKKYFSGLVQWQSELNLYFPENQDFSYDLTIKSDLNDAELLLPAPYNKPLNQTLPLLVNVQGQVNDSTIEASLGEQLNFYGHLDHQQTQLTRAHIVLGEEQMLLPMNGFHITTAMDEINYFPWHNFVIDIVDSLPEGESKSPIIQTPQRIRGSINQLNVAGQKLNGVSFNLLNKEQWWLLQLNGDKARSEIKIHHDLASFGVEVDADFIHFEDDFTKGETTSTDDDVIFEQMIPVKFECGSCKYKNYDFGQLNFAFERNKKEQIELKYFNAKRGDTHLDIAGHWQYNKASNQTTFNGRFSSKDFEQELKLMGFDSIVRDSGLEMEFDVSWQGSPQDFDVLALQGEIKLVFDDGYLADVDDKGARLLSVLSLRSLVRKLSLDFRDIFSNGMFYEDVTGDFVIQDGYIYTDNIKMNGAAGDLTVQGNTNLDTHELDYKMSFTPKVTSSIPVIVGWMVNPVIGLATLAVDEVIQSAEVISKINFELTGTVDEPNFREVDRSSRDINVGKSKAVATTNKTESQKKVEPKQPEVIEPPVPDVNNPNTPKKDLLNQSNKPGVNSEGKKEQQGIDAHV